MPRLFIALDLPDQVKEYLRAAQELLPQKSGIQMAKTGDFHLTLKFLGECEEEKIEEIKSVLRRIPFEPFEAVLEKTGVFGGLYPKVVWVGVRVPLLLYVTSKMIEEKLTPLGFSPENRFVPHITLARIKFCSDPKRFMRALERIVIEPRAFPAKKFSLFESELLAAGARHRIIASFPEDL